jgi:hypothetical protein
MHVSVYMSMGASAHQGFILNAFGAIQDADGWKLGTLHYRTEEYI